VDWWIRVSPLVGKPGNVCFLFFWVLSQEIGWEERLRNDVFCVERYVKPCSILFYPGDVWEFDGCQRVNQNSGKCQSQETGWKEHVQNDLFCVEWDVKPCSICPSWHNLVKENRLLLSPYPGLHLCLLACCKPLLLVLRILLLNNLVNVFTQYPPTFNVNWQHLQ